MNFRTVAFHTAYVLLLIAGFATQPSYILVAYLAVCLAYVLANLRRLRPATRPELTILGWMLLGPASLIVVSIPRAGAAAAFHLFVAVTAAIAACAATRAPEVYRAASKWGLIASQALVVVYVARLGITGFPLENLIAGHSSNGITSYLVALQVNYSVVTYVLRRRVTWVTQLTTLAICLVGYGRGSILASAALIGASLAVSAFPRRGWSPLMRVVLVGAAVASVFAFRSEIVWFAEANTKIGAGFEDTGRTLMLQQYVEQLTPVTAIIGGSYDNTVIVRDFRSNPHNSYIRAHHIFGLGYLIVIAFLPFYTAGRSRLAFSDKAYVLLMMMVLYFRAFTEPILFPTVFDFFFFGMCFVVLQAPKELANRAEGYPSRELAAGSPA